MRKLLLKLSAYGIHPIQFFQAIRSLPWFYRTKRQLKKQLGDNPEFKITRNYACLTDRFDKSGALSGHYFHMDLLMAKRVFANNPQKHVDVGSSIPGFVAHVASFREIEVFDVRPNESTVSNIRFKQSDFSDPAFALVDYTDSVSCLHAIEHFGLGRYGDPVDAEGHKKGLDNLYKILKKGGTFYFATPIGPQRIEFNAHRVFSVAYLLKQFENRYRINHFSYVDDAGNLFEHTALTPELVESNYGCNYGCGIFEMTKL
jgi:SAM-dependent methyltransferase